YRAARSRGIRVLLAGYYGDTLYQRAVRWIGALLRGGRVGRISAELFQQLRSSEGWRHPFFRQGLSCLVRKPSVPKFAWLRNEFRPISNHHTHFETGNLQIALSKSAMAAMAGIDLRYPYRDRRLLSFMAAIPPDQLYSHLWQKIIARRAMRGLLPDTVRWRQQETTLTPLFEHGLQAEIKTIYHIVAAPDALWRQVVQPKILPTQEAPFSNWLQATNDWGKLLIWRFALLELWRKRFNYE
ncbi:MAG: asparagine synthase-related protein, partial [Candidatus Promineifilaceae bacterium]